MRVIFLAAFTLSLLFFSNCKKPSSPPEPEPEPENNDTIVYEPLLPIFYGEDTLLNWTKIFHDGNASFSIIQFPTKDTGYITDNDRDNIGRMKATTDGGKTWSGFISLPQEANVIKFRSGKRGYAFRDRNSSVFHLVPLAFTTDGGKTWGELFRSSTIFTTIEDISIPTDTAGYFFTRQGEFVKINNPNIYTGQEFYYTRYGNKTSNNVVYDCDFADADNGWVATSKNISLAGEQGSRILNTTDKGNTWKSQFEDEKLYIQDIVFHDKNNGWASTYTKEIFRTNDGGKNWIRTKIEKADGSRVTGFKMVFVSAKKGFMISTNEILETNDGGVTWKRSCKDGKELFESLYFTPPNILWANTEKTIYKFVF